MSDTPPRWRISYRPAQGGAPIQMLTIEAESMVTALKEAQMKLAEMDGSPFKITGIEEEGGDEPPRGDIGDHLCRVEWIAGPRGDKLVRNIGSGPVLIHTDITLRPPSLQPPYIQPRRLEPGEELSLISGQGITHRVERAP